MVRHEFMPKIANSYACGVHSGTWLTQLILPLCDRVLLSQDCSTKSQLRQGRCASAHGQLQLEQVNKREQGQHEFSWASGVFCHFETHPGDERRGR